MGQTGTHTDPHGPTRTRTDLKDIKDLKDAKDINGIRSSPFTLHPSPFILFHSPLMARR